MISVEEALARVFDLCAPVGRETVPLRAAAGRVLATAVTARRDQPPFSASAMDGYAVREADCGQGASFDVVGTSAAGHGYVDTVGKGEAVRIFTGAPVPAGADRVIIQEDVRREGDRITVTAPLGAGTNIRPCGGDFSAGDSFAPTRRLTPQDVTLLAAMNVAQVEVYCRPEVAIIATGDELVMPGEDPGPSQIIASNSFGLAAMVEAAGGIARMLPIAPDDPDGLRHVFTLAEGADMVVTIGGASVGDHDIVGKVAADLGLDRAFYKIAMRPGKPLMAGRLGGAVMLGLPGNPVSAMVTGHLFMLPALAVLSGLAPGAAPTLTAVLTQDISENGPREHYMRARLSGTEIAPFERQDSSLMSILSQANALLKRPPHDRARKAGETVDYVPL